MRTLYLLTLCLVLSVAAGAQSDILYYKFMASTGTMVNNFAPGGPATGTVVSTYPATGNYIFATGITPPSALYGSCIDPVTKLENTSNYNYVDSGWVPQVNGSFTVAWFQKERTPNTSNSLAYLISGVGSFRIFMGGVANRALYLRAWGGSPSDLVLRDPANATTTQPTFDLLGESENRWVHVAIVVDATAMTATWYIDGLPLSPVIPITAGANVSGSSPLKVGQHTSTGSSYRHDLDEFRFCTRAATAAEVRAWAGMRLAESWNFGAGCNGGTLTATAGPVMGLPFLMTIGGPAGAAGILSVGFNRNNLGSLTLPLDLGTMLSGMSGCMFANSMAFTIPVTLDGTGAAIRPLIIPNNNLYLGMPFFTQALMISGGATFVLTPSLGGMIGL